MPSAVYLSLAALAALAGMAWLALAMDVHWQQAEHRGPPPVRLLRTLGWGGLALSLALCLAADHVSMAALTWPLLLTGAALLVAFTLSWKPRLLRLFFPAGA